MLRIFCLTCFFCVEMKWFPFETLFNFSLIKLPFLKNNLFQTHSPKFFPEMSFIHRDFKINNIYFQLCISGIQNHSETNKNINQSFVSGNEKRKVLLLSIWLMEHLIFPFFNWCNFKDRLFSFFLYSTILFHLNLLHLHLVIQLT
jgi:hypothetical protein